MTLTDYQSLALRTASTLTTERDRLTCAALGLCGESGEFADLVKKHLFHGHALDRDKLARELGDVLWYVALGAHALGMDLDAIAAMNVEKLRARYPDGFSAERSIHREPEVARVPADAPAEVATLKREIGYTNLERAAAATMIERLARRLRVVGGTPLNLPNEVPGNADAARRFLTAFDLSASGDRVGDGS